MSASKVATGLAITNPLVKYRALVASKALVPDQGQLRLALHLQKLYERLKDYEPEIEYAYRLDQISRAVNNDRPIAREYGTPTRRNSWRSLFGGDEKKSDTLALTRRLTSQDAAMQLDSPKGLLLHGEVGTGKSLLVDVFADCLPTRKKRRWHFNTFMLETFAKLEAFRQTSHADDEYSLLKLAREMIQTTPIIFFDEFQLPDRTASKLLTNLLTAFFQLGGVLVATSNRMPEELAKASGVEFTPPPPKLGWGWRFGLKGSPNSVGMGAPRNEFAVFLDVLKARCEVWEMEGGKDYRRMESGTSTPVRGLEEEEWRLDGHGDLQHSAGMAGWPVSEEQKSFSQGNGQSEPQTGSTSLPKHYNVAASAQEKNTDVYQRLLKQAAVSSHQFVTGSLQVYGRTISIPRTYAGIADWTFAELCQTTYGPADYISLASTYHTLILHDVPALTWLMKNEARRLITLLDALYECRCKLAIVNAAAEPDSLFFSAENVAGQPRNSAEADAMSSETFAEAYQDATAPFRPNVLSSNPTYSETQPQLRPEPDYTHARLANCLSPDALEDDPPNRPRRSSSPFGRSFGLPDASLSRPEPRPSSSFLSSPNFSEASAFTGEDERFAYKRAQSRLWEMCGAKWWAREGGPKEWHRPLPVEARRWERAASGNEVPQERASSPANVGAGGDATADPKGGEEMMFNHGASPFRTASEPPPKFSWTHAWGMMRWGRKAGAWGKGVEGLEERGNPKR